MESSQDLAINTLTILDDTGATIERTGCAIFNGGINVVKNIIACDVETTVLIADKAKITDCLSIKQNLYVDGNILPFTNYSTASLGNATSQWNNIHAICANITQVNSKNLSTKSIVMENMKVTTCTIDITDISAGSSIYNIVMETGVTIINLTSTFDIDRLVTLTLPLPSIGTNHDIKKIIFKQNKCNNIKWIYNTDEFILGNSYEQIFDLININGLWRFVNYTDADKKVILDNANDIDAIQITQTAHDTSLNLLKSRIDSLIDFNNFLSVSDSSENTILDFVDKNIEIANDISGIHTSINTITTTLTYVNGIATLNATELASLKTNLNANITDLSSNLVITNNVVNVFKSVTDITFNNINAKLLCIDSSIANLTLKSSEAILDIRRARELIDLVDKKVCDHIANTDAKMAFLNDSIKHLNEKMDLILNNCGIHFH